MSLKISIITICYNDLDALKMTSISIAKQIYSCIEWIVVDGKSTDGTVDFLSNNNNVYKYISEADSGIYHAMNKGTALASGDYVVYLNAGDVFFNADALITCVNKIENHSVILCGAFFLYSNKISRFRAPRPMASIWHSIPANHQAILFKKDILGCAPYDTSYHICGDYNLLARLYMDKKSSLVLNVPLVSFEVGGVSTFALRVLSLEALRVQREILNLSGWLSAASWLRRKFSMYCNIFLYKMNGVFNNA